MKIIYDYFYRVFCITKLLCLINLLQSHTLYCHQKLSSYTNILSLFTRSFNLAYFRRVFSRYHMGQYFRKRWGRGSRPIKVARFGSQFLVRLWHRTSSRFEYRKINKWESYGSRKRIYLFYFKLTIRMDRQNVFNKPVILR